MRAIDADKLKARIRPAEEIDTRCSVLISDVKKIFHTQIDEAPTITYEDLVPHGRWGALDYDFDRDEYTRPCSNCRRKTTDYGNYCPNCGAKMDGGKDNESKNC